MAKEIRKKRISDEEICQALVKTKGMLYLAAEAVGCHHDTIYNRMKTSEKIVQTLRSQRGRVIDTAELKLYNGIMAGQQWAIQMCLKTLGKDRGYVERTEVDSNVVDGANINTPLADAMKRLSSEDAASLRAILEKMGGREPRNDADDAGPRPVVNELPELSQGELFDHSEE